MLHLSAAKSAAAATAFGTATACFAGVMVRPFGSIYRVPTILCVIVHNLASPHPAEGRDRVPDASGRNSVRKCFFDKTLDHPNCWRCFLPFLLQPFPSAGVPHGFSVPALARRLP